MGGSQGTAPLYPIAASVFGVEGVPPAVSRSLKGLRADPDLPENYYTHEDISRIFQQFAWYRTGRDHHDDTLSHICAGRDLLYYMMASVFGK